MKLIERIKSSKSFKKVALCVSALAISVVGAVGACAEGPTVPDNATIISGIKSVTDTVTASFNIETIAAIVGITLAASVGLFLFWWGGRKVLRMARNAFTKGKISL